MSSSIAEKSAGDRLDSRVSWMGGLNVPSHWVRTRVKNLVVSMRAGESISANDIEHNGDYPVYGANGIRGFSGRPTHRGVHVLIGRQGALCGNVHLVTGEFWASEHAIVASPSTAVDPRFFANLLEVMNLGQYSTNAAQPGIGVGQIGPLDVCIPPLDEQRAIADHLDRETAQIDALVAKQEEFIGLLRERRDSMWGELFDGISDNLEPVPLRRVVTSIVDGPFGSSLTSKHYTDAGTRVIRLGNIGIDAFRAEDEAYIADDYADKLSGHDVQAGDVVIAGLGDKKWPLGRAALIPDIGRAIVKADCFRVRPGSRVSGKYLAWVLSSPQTRVQVAQLSRGSTRQRINTSVAMSIEVPVPASDVQEAVVDISARELSTIDALIAMAEEHIALAKERRSALITAAVTGQIDVPTARKAG